MSIEAAVRPGVAVEHGIDRLIYVFMATLFIVAAIAGFAPRSAAILSGAMPNPPVVVHVHAALMTAWLLLFLAQTSLMATGRKRIHQTLGLVSFLLAPAMVAAMTAVTIRSFGPATAAGFGDLVSNILLAQVKDLVLFSLFYTWAILTRRTAPETHKRMMLMATLVLLDAATGRIEWLPGNILRDNSYALAPLYHLALLAPVVVYELVRFGRVHRAYVIGIALFLLFIIPTSVLWSTPGWLRTAPALMGVGG